MTSLSTNAQGFYTVALLVADLERAIATPDTLRSVMSNFRDINRYHGNIDLKVADLKKAAIALLTELKVDLADINSLKLANKATTARLASEDAKINNTDRGIISNQCLQWLSHASTHGIVMVRQHSGCNGRDVWVTYGSHAKVIGLLTGRDALSEQGFSKIEILASAIEFYQGLVLDQGVRLTFV